MEFLNFVKNLFEIRIKKPPDGGLFGGLMRFVIDYG